MKVIRQQLCQNYHFKLYKWRWGHKNQLNQQNHTYTNIKHALKCFLLEPFPRSKEFLSSWSEVVSEAVQIRSLAVSWGTWAGNPSVLPQKKLETSSNTFIGKDKTMEPSKLAFSPRETDYFIYFQFFLIPKPTLFTPPATHSASS